MGRLTTWTAVAAALLAAGGAPRAAAAADPPEPADPPPEGVVAPAAAVLPGVARPRSGRVGPGGTAPAAAGPARDDGGIRAGLLGGWERGDVSGLALRAVLEVPSRVLSPRLRLSWGVSVGWARLSRDDRDFVAERRTTVNVLTALAAPRLTLRPLARAAVFAEAGAGMYHASSRVRREFSFALGHQIDTWSDRHLVARLGGGAWVDATSRLRVTAAAGLERYAGGRADTVTALHGGLVYRL